MIDGGRINFGEAKEMSFRTADETFTQSVPCKVCSRSRCRCRSFIITRPTATSYEKKNKFVSVAVNHYSRKGKKKKRERKTVKTVLLH